MKGAASVVQRKRLFLFTHPRTASNLLVRILNLENQPSLRSPDSKTNLGNKYEYFFVSTQPLRIGLADRSSEEWSQDEQAEMKHQLQVSADELRRYIDAAQVGGRSVFVKEHLLWMLSPEAEDLVKAGPQKDRFFWKAQFPHDDHTREVIKSHDDDSAKSPGVRNETVLPDDFLRTLTPTFLIRHPALVFPSLYRTSVDLEGREEAKKNANGMFRLEMTFRWTRCLFEWYETEWKRGETVAAPLIIDADDIILNPNVVAKYCDLVGLDATKCLLEWERATVEEEGGMNFLERRMKSSLLASTGIIQQGKGASGLDLGQEARKWSEELGEEEGKKLLNWISAAMPDYDFLKERRLVADG
ncbi:hypothetical protein H2200_003210 [Cladophialophora chaetospira]|uniref:Sulfotransferase domain-containing protein n=1 Tax=Cladophialophora chaetospira TaxID=386627 RepID=A0AA38XGX3_9EURO|nr:hypothetical protein H2200_003210 [Cladophialophora chaetospira]